nr:hypothetical protein [Tanacetum cinerariifolium]
MAAVEVPQTLEYKGGQLSAASVLEAENFTNWKKRKTKDFEAKYHKVKAKLALLSSSASTPSSSSGKNKGLIAETYDWDDEEVSSDENEVKSLMALTDEERVSVGKEISRNCDWTKISMKKVRTLLEMEDNDDIKILSRLSVVPSNESQRNTTDPLVVSSDSLAIDYDSADESLVCSTPHLSQKKLDGAEPVSRPKTIKSILKSKSTFKAETLKNDLPLAIVMKEHNELKLQISKKKSSYSRNKNAQQGLTQRILRLRLAECNMNRKSTSAKALENSKVFFSIPTGGIFREVRVNTFRNTIGAHYQPHPSEYVASPSIDVVRQWFPMNGYWEEVSAKGTLNKNLLPPSGKKGGTSKAPSGSKTGHSKKRKESSLAMDSNPSQPLVFTPVDTEMHKEDQQATGGLTSLGVTSEARANHQLSSGMSAFNLNDHIYSASFIIHSESALGNDASATSTTEADLINSAPSDFVPQQQVTSQIEEETSTTIKLEDLAKLVSHVQPSFKDLDLPKDDLIIFVNDSDEVHATENVKTEDTLVPKSSSPRSSQVQELTN